MTHSYSATHNYNVTPYGYSEPPCKHTELLQFHGELLHSIVGLYFLGIGIRTYNPRIFRFHSSDSLSPFSLGGINSYSYCFNDPVNLSDPSGQSPLLTRRKVIKYDENWTLKSRNNVTKKLRWGVATTKNFLSDDSPDKLLHTKLFREQLHDPSPNSPHPGRPRVKSIDVAPEGYTEISDSTSNTLRAYLRAANKHYQFIIQNVRHLPPDSETTLSFIKNAREARHLRNILKGIRKSTPNASEYELLTDILKAKL
ncbi:RHS repeat-associated core domain-containing protein [Pseudomonas sp. C5pp]|uniref:RHS repeat-associated core domain-containing protein n=1 Tax=Pseudomonas sp. C5pp TaxID=1586081 RepID=UPI0009E32C8B|nr:RHS repeat-associated core domain-containing protein [Pseudomonas sp. C5pp]